MCVHRAYKRTEAALVALLEAQLKEEKDIPRSVRMSLRLLEVAVGQSVNLL